MVKIEKVSELGRIMKSNYGYVVVVGQSNATFHKPTCEIITEKNYIESRKSHTSRYHWFSSYSLAQKEFPSLVSCNVCNP